MVTDWTPGPWKVGGPTGFVNQISIEPAIGVVYGAGQEIAANARLIAAAPELVEALRECLDEIRECDDMTGVRARAISALAKAGAL